MCALEPGTRRALRLRDLNRRHLLGDLPPHGVGRRTLAGLALPGLADRRGELLVGQPAVRAGLPPRPLPLAFGVAGGVVLLFLQTKGLILIAAAAGFTLLAARGRRGLRAAALLLGGALAVVAPLLLVWRPSVLVREW
ncbi:MAG: hypothetical protein ABR607_17440, partial [Pyrinomonadaceae bacterium]